MKQLFNEEDLDQLILEKISECKGYSNVCALIETPEGKERVKNRVKELIKDDGITSIPACLAQIESELIMDV